MRVLSPASCLPLAEPSALLQAAYGDRELLEVLKTLLGFGVEVASGQRQIVKHPPMYKVSCTDFASHASRNHG